jgi:hypothetical protein
MKILLGDFNADGGKPNEVSKDNEVRVAHFTTSKNPGLLLMVSHIIR